MPLMHEIAEGRRFDQFADGYDHNPGQYPVRTLVNREVVEVVSRRSPKFVVDVGCGTGQALIALAHRITAGVGMDVSERMLAIARRKAQHAGFRHVQFHFGSFHDLRTKHDFWPEDQRPDVIIETYALHHLPQSEKRQVLASMAAAVDSSGGAIVLGDLMFFEDPAGLEAEFENAGYDPTTDKPETADTMAQMLEDLGFMVETCPIHPLAGIVIGVTKGAGA